MPEQHSQGFFTLVQRELQEYRNSLVMTPVVIALVLCTMMLISVLLANAILLIYTHRDDLRQQPRWRKNKPKG